jgi:hypothetical protein
MLDGEAARLEKRIYIVGGDTNMDRLEMFRNEETRLYRASFLRSHCCD